LGQTDGCTGPTFTQFIRDEGGRSVRVTCVVSYPGASNDLLIGGTVDGDVFLTRIDTLGNLRWRRVIETESESTELSTLAEIVVDPAGMIAGAGSSFTSPNQQRAYIFRYDPNADRVLYIKQPPFLSEATGLKLLGNDEYLLSGSRVGQASPIFVSGYLQKIRQVDGSIIEDGSFYDFRGNEAILDLIPAETDGFYAVGNISATGGPRDIRASFLKLSGNGTPIFARTGPISGQASGRLYAFDVERVGNKLFVIHWGNIGDITGALGTNIMMSCFLTDGTHEWTRRYDLEEFDGESAIELVPYAGGLLAYGFNLIGERDPFLMKFNLRGQVEWSRTYNFPGNATVYLRANQQLYASPGGIVALASYTYPGRPKEGLIMRLDPLGQSDNACMNIQDLTVTVTDMVTTWERADLEHRPASLPWDLEMPRITAPSLLAAFDECDNPCEDCNSRSFVRAPICRGDSVAVNGIFRSTPGVYADTIPGSGPACDSIILTEVAISDGPTAAFSVSRQCGLATARVRISASGGEFPYTYQWSIPGQSGPAADLNAGNYQVTVNDALGCFPFVVDITVENPPPGALDYRIEAPSCAGASDGAVVLEPPGVGSIRLLPSNSFQSDQLDGLAAGDYMIILQDSAGCEAFRQIMIPEAPPATVDIDANRLVRLGDPLEARAENTGAVPFSNFRWSTSGQDTMLCVDCPSTSFMPNADTWLYLEASSRSGCVATDSLRILVDDAQPRVYLPTAFSPNGDGINDELVPGLGNEVARINRWEIFDRWGNLRWEHSEADDSWDGGKASAGTYIFQFEATLTNGRTIIRSGSVMLLR
jgi:gliding motility-associated-like protein